jgi:uncharacterized protein (DUF305 family)
MNTSFLTFIANLDHFKKRRLVLVLIILLLSARLAAAQEMKMDKQQDTAASSGRIFLAMMDTMMVKMEHEATDRSAEADFLSQMIPHHQGAIAMARYEIQHGKNFGMIQLAKSILAEQSIELQQMHIWLERAPAKEIKITAGFKSEMDQTMTDMMDHMPGDSRLAGTDRAFALVMIPHHQAAVDMARVVLKYTGEQQTIAFARQLISSEQVEIQQMSSYLK